MSDDGKGCQVVEWRDAEWWMGVMLRGGRKGCPVVEGSYARTLPAKCPGLAAGREGSARQVLELVLRWGHVPCLQSAN